MGNGCSKRAAEWRQPSANRPDYRCVGYSDPYGLRADTIPGGFKPTPTNPRPGVFLPGNGGGIEKAEWYQDPLTAAEILVTGGAGEAVEAAQVSKYAISRQASRYAARQAAKQARRGTPVLVEAASRPGLLSRGISALRRSGPEFSKGFAEGFIDASSQGGYTPIDPGDSAPSRWGKIAGQAAYQVFSAWKDGS